MNQSLFKRFSLALKFRPQPETVLFLTLDEISARFMHDKATIFARFTNTQKVSKPEVVGSKPLCRKCMSRGDGVEIHSAISSTALSLHYLHSCKIRRYFIQFNYHPGSAREAISASSLVRYLHRRHHLRLF